MPDSPLDQVLETVRRALHGRRAVALERVQRIERALADYALAVEEQIGREFAREHGLSQLKPERDPSKAAESLRAAVLQLPELVTPAVEAPSQPDPQLEQAPVAPTLRPHFAPVVVVGGPTRKAANVPALFAERLEWIDTTRQGTVAIGNLTQRIRSGRVAALVLLEGLVGHRHSEPLVSAARDAGIPFVYAGKGGRASLDRALSDVMKRLG